MRLAMALGSVCVLVCSVFACSEAGVVVEPTDAGQEPDSRTPQYDSSRGDAVAPLDPQRLVRGPQSYKGKDGAPVTVADGWKDTKRNEVCTPLPSTDGATRCLPLEGVIPWREPMEYVQTYADAACSPTQKAVVVGADWKVSPKYLLSPYEGESVRFAVSPIAKSATRELYVFDFCASSRDGGVDAQRKDAASPDCNACRKVAVPAGQDLYVESGEVAPAEFGEFRVY